MDPPGASRPTTQAPSMGATTYARANDILDMLDSKGPTTESERIYRKVKTLYKQLLGLHRAGPETGCPCAQAYSHPRKT